MITPRPLVLDGTALTTIDVRRIARSAAAIEPLVFGPEVHLRLRTNASLAAEVAARNALYGRTTGVGANRHVQADDSDGLHGRRLLRSHAAGSGAVLPGEVGRALMVIRANQLAMARAGVDPTVPAAIISALNDGLSPVVRSHGGLGTGDITVLAELGLSLIGERPWSDGTVRAYLTDIDASGALPLMSSSAPTLAVAALAVEDLRSTLHSLAAVASLSAWAVRANTEAWSEVGAASRPHPGMVEIGETLRALMIGSTWAPARLQDPFGWRCLVPVHGGLLDSLAAATDELGIDLNASVENPLYADDLSWHHGGFHHTGLALALDRLRLATVQAAGLSLARLTKLHDPGFTGGRPFLADGPQGSSGTMVLEYTAASAMAELRQWAAPATLGHTVISIGLEDHASFAWQAALSTRASLGALRAVIACELVAAVRAVRMQGAVDGGPVLHELLDRCAALPQPSGDTPPADDLTIANHVLDALSAQIHSR